MSVVQTRGFFRSESINYEARTVDLVFVTEAEILRYRQDGSKFYEVLPIDPAHAKLDRLNAGAALLDNHDRDSITSQLGVVEKAWLDLEKKVGMVTVRFSSHPEVDRIWSDVASGIIQNVSFAYQVEKYISQNEYHEMRRAMAQTLETSKEDESREEESEDGNKSADQDDQDENARYDEDAQSLHVAENIPVLVGLGWEPLEVSLVTIPADIDAGVRSDVTQAPLFRSILNTIKSGEQTRMAVTNEVENDRNQIVEEVTNEVTKRFLEIQEITRIAKLPKDVEERFLKSKDSLDEIRKKAFAEISKASETPEIRSYPSITSGNLDEVSTRRQGMESAILHRSNPKRYPLHESGRKFANLSLLGMARRSLQASGVHTDELSDPEIATRSFQGTSEFPILLQGVVNKSLRADYEAAPSVWRAFSREVPAKDFRPIYRLQFGDAPLPTLVGEKGEITRGTISEAGESYRVRSYAKIINFTRELLINDDLQFIATVPSKLGLACAELEANTVMELITSNPIMADGKTLFHPDHNNIAQGNHALDIESTSMVRASMRKHKGLDGRRLNLTPKNYLVPASLETAAEQFVSQNLLATTSGNINVFAGKLGVLCDARLDDVSTTDWYMIAAPEQVDMIEVAYLTGLQGPQLETRYGFEFNGMEIKILHDFGAGVIDYRGLYKVPGKLPTVIQPQPTGRVRG